MGESLSPCARRVVGAPRRFEGSVAVERQVGAHFVVRFCDTLENGFGEGYGSKLAPAQLFAGVVERERCEDSFEDLRDFEKRAIAIRRVGQQRVRVGTDWSLDPRAERWRVPPRG